MAASNVVRRVVRASPAVRRIVKSAPVQYLIQTQRAARVLEPSAAFVSGQLGRRELGRYAVRPTGRVVHLRHNTRDVEILNEIFGGTGGALSYAPPPEIASLLEGRPITILDLGGNIGLFGVYALQRWSVAALRSFEPDPANARLLRATIAANQAAWEMEEAAVSNAQGRLRFTTGLFAKSHAAGADEPAIDVPMVDLFDVDTAVDLLKMDIEGGEWSILGDPRFRDVDAKAIVMEWHQELCPAERAHDEVRRLLAEARYEVVHDDPAEHGENGVIWARKVAA